MIGIVMFWILVVFCAFVVLAWMVDCIYVRKCGTLSRADLYRNDTATDVLTNTDADKYRKVEVGLDKIKLNF